MSDAKTLSWCGALAVALVAGVAGANDGWKTVEDDDVVIKVRNRPDGVGREVWAEGDVAANAYDIQTALKDGASFRQWMPYVKESRLVSQGEDGSRVMYAKLSFPIVDPRDYVVHIVDEQTVSADGTGEYVQRWKQTEGAVPERRGVVRLKYNEGTWRVTPKGEGKARVVYKFSVDPGGSVPTWLANMGQTDGVEDVYKALAKRAKRLGEERRKAPPAPPAKP
jgi:hypothetical protein